MLAFGSNCDECGIPKFLLHFMCSPVEAVSTGLQPDSDKANLHAQLMQHRETQWMLTALITATMCVRAIIRSLWAAEE